ncbi:hypothetical protein ES708_17501 [subsurface metagenome]
MNLKKFTLLILAFVTVALFGCATMPHHIDSVVKVTHRGPGINRAVQVSAGGMMMQTQHGVHFTAYRLDEEVKVSLLGNSCTVSPQVFVNVRQDGQFYYAASQKNYVKPSPLNWEQASFLRTCPCGVKFSKNDLKVSGVVFENTEYGTFTKIGPYSVDDDLRPVLKPVPMINIYAPNFLRKTLKFDSFADDFLALHYMEEKGTENGYDAQGAPVAVPPDVTERMYEFDLQASKVIAVQGAKLEILEARPDKLVYKIVRQMSAE